MKGPGLPGFRRNAGSGFYKGSGFDINTSNRSPMKEGEEEADIKAKEEYNDKIAKARANYADIMENGTEEEKAKLNWQENVSTISKETKDNQTITTIKNAQFGILKKQEVIGPLIKPGDKGYDAWLKADKSKFKDREVFRGDLDVQITEPKKEIEWTNVGLGRSMIGQNTGTVKHDNNDGTFRYKIQKDNGQEFGELSANDIDELVKSGKMKHEMKAGRSTGRLLMSKDYHENTYQPLVQMEEDRETNYDTWQSESSDFRTNANKEAIKTALEAGKKGSKKYTQAFKDYKKQVKSENPKMYPKRGLPEWMHGDPNFPADYNQPKLGIYNDDEMVNNYTNYTKNDEGQWVMKEGANGINHEAYNEMTEEEQNEIQKNLNSNSKKGKGATGTDGIQKAPTPQLLANKDDFATGSEQEMRINEQEIE